MLLYGRMNFLKLWRMNEGFHRKLDQSAGYDILGASREQKDNLRDERQSDDIGHQSLQNDVPESSRN